MKNILIKGGPGTGKTLISRAMAYYIGHDGLDIESVFTKDICVDKQQIELFIQSEFVEYIQIHPSMTYEDIIYGIETTLTGSLSMAYAEKRIKQLCDRANGSSDMFFIILDDIGRTNAGNLLGNLLYAMEYRNQPVSLVDENTIIIPDNVYIIMTECRSLYGNPLEYALRRRFDYEKELFSESSVLERYYGASLTSGTMEIIINVFSTICNFIRENIVVDSTIQCDNYIPGHGMFIVDKNSSQNEILSRINQKFKYQIIPYMIDLLMSGILNCNRSDLDYLFSNIESQLNVGQMTTNNTATVQKVFCGTQKKVPLFDLSDSYNYYKNIIIPAGCKEHRSIIENICDAILTNGIFSVNKVLSDILLNTRFIRFENRNRSGVYAAFMVESDQNNNYGYITSVANNHVRSYYSSNPCKTGRWATYKDAPAYRVLFTNGTVKQYILLNAFRNTGFDTTNKVIHAKDNTASIYCALYHLVKIYLSTYETTLSSLANVDSTYEKIYKLVMLERRYWDEKNNESKMQSGSDLKLKTLGGAVLNIKTLWNTVGTIIDVDEAKYNNLINGITQITTTAYEDLYNITGKVKRIEIKGMDTMIDLNDYQKIMENIGVHQMIFQGPPGTSKTYESKKFVLKQLNHSSSIFTKNIVTQEDISNELEQYKLSADDYENPQKSSKLSKGGWDLVQFHPSYGYEDFIRGIEVKPVNGVPTYTSVNRILGKIAEFSKMAEIASTSMTKPKFYLIIDEINRANLATVFGELIYGLEYRDSKVSTPYEVKDNIQNTIDKDIVLGKNLFIIGTMNTADKSIDSIDYAIRRRFIFIDSPAKREVVINNYQKTMRVTDKKSIELLLFDAVGYIFDGNRFFNEEYQRSDVRIGHTYFLRKNNSGYMEEMIEKFIFQVIPILREYIKDGIIDSYEDLIGRENTIEDIKAADENERIKKLGENIMMFTKYFGEKNKTEKTIDNNYIAKFIEDLCTELGY